jgi:hypothetical protein
MATERSSSIEAAKRYLARGWSVLPLRSGDKRPLIRWEHLKGIVRVNSFTLPKRQNRISWPLIFLHFSESI